MRKRIALAAVGAALLATAPARAGCDFRGWSKDRDPAGLNVRSAPGTGGAVIARLPPPRREGDETIAVEMHVIDGRDGWLLIDRAEFSGYDLPAKTVFTGRGWVSGRMVDLTVQDARVRARPAATEAILDAPRERPTGGGEMLRLDRILACDGRWIEIEGRFTGEDGADPRPTRGWVTGLCGNQVTTCP